MREKLENVCSFIMMAKKTNKPKCIQEPPNIVFCFKKANKKSQTTKQMKDLWF